MTTTPQRRIVTKQKYLRVMGLKFTLNTLATSALAAGVVSAISFICWIVIAHVAQKDTLRTWLCCNLLTVGISMMFALSGLMYRKSNQIEPVEILTEHNAHLLPLHETLVRVSGSPASIAYKDELLRAPRNAPETNRDEMLRSLGGNSRF